MESERRVTPSHPGAFAARPSHDVSTIFCVIIFLLAFFSPFKSTSGTIAAGAALEYSDGDEDGNLSNDILCLFVVSVIAFL